jgi:hypothetical protein
VLSKVVYCDWVILWHKILHIRPLQVDVPEDDEEDGEEADDREEQVPILSNLAFFVSGAE